MNNYSSTVLNSLSIAQAEAMARNNNELSPFHLLWGLIKNPKTTSSKGLKKYTSLTKSELDKLPTVKNQSEENLRPSATFSKWLTLASSRATQNNREEMNESDLLFYIKDIIPQITEPMMDIFNDEQEDEPPAFLVNLNDLAEAGKLDPVIGRSKEIRSLMEILGRRSKNNPVIVGPAGVGKTAIVEGLAEAIVKGKVPDVLEGKTVYALDMASLMAGTKFQGEFEERIQTLIKFIKEKKENSILFIDEFHQMVGAGKSSGGGMDGANLLKPALARGDLNCIGATTMDEYQKFILSDSALDRRFRPVIINEPTKEDAIEILMGLREKFESHHGIKISDEAIYNAVILSMQYITDKNLPDKAIDLVDEASASMKLSAEAMPEELVALESTIRSKKISSQVEKNNKEIIKQINDLEKEFKEKKEKWEQEVFNIKRVSELKNKLEKCKFEYEQAERKQDYEKASQLRYSVIPEIEQQLDQIKHDWVLNSKDIAKVICKQTGIPLEKILKSKQERILELKEHLRRNVLGQSEATDEIANTLVTSHAGLSDETRPLGSFLLMGPSGVGKTETAKQLSNFLFNTMDNIVRLDMSEFSEKHSVAKLIGAPAGYVGYDEGGILTEAVRRKPYAIILFDEIEKAHPDMSDILLQILDDGRLTDNKGRTINFKNTIVLMTTNATDVEACFKPEVLGRIDSILHYKNLDPSIMHRLVKKELKLLNERLINKEIVIKLGNQLLEMLASKGFDARYGARPLARVFSKTVTRPLSEKLVRGELEQNSYLLDLENDQLTIKEF